MCVSLRRMRNAHAPRDADRRRSPAFRGRDVTRSARAHAGVCPDRIADAVFTARMCLRVGPVPYPRGFIACAQAQQHCTGIITREKATPRFELHIEEERAVASVNGGSGSNQGMVIARVKQCIVDAIGVKLSPTKIPDDMALLDKGLGLDSVSLLRLVAELEQEFDVQIEESALRPELFRSVVTLSAYVEGRTQMNGRSVA
jgi:acyl carrier protein